jgi:hypothetical protein
MSKLPATLLMLSLLFVRGAAAQAPAVAPAKKPVASPAVKSAAKTTASNEAPAKRTVRADRLDLETTVVSGNRELPKVLYIVPWKKADLGELPAQPFNTLLDEVLQPVDRDVFKREVKYFQAIASGVGSSASVPKSSAVPPPTIAP